MHDFKVGEWVECIRNEGYPLTFHIGQIYRIECISETEPCLIFNEARGVFLYSSRFKHLSSVAVDHAPHSDDRVTAPDIVEARLHALWLAVPANCCAKCAAPVPCKYHE